MSYMINKFSTSLNSIFCNYSCSFRTTRPTKTTLRRLLCSSSKPAWVNDQLALIENPVTSSNRIRYFYENTLRFDLLLKLNYINIMQVPRIRKIIILADLKHYNNVKSVSLGLEILCGQKVFCTFFSGLAGKRNRKNGASFLEKRSGTVRPIGSRSKQAFTSSSLYSKAQTFERSKPQGFVLQSNTALLYCSLNDRTMYNFLDKLISLRLTIGPTGSSYSNCKIKGQEVQLTLTNREMRLFPEIQNHFDFFESFHALQIKLVTSASNEKETKLLWTGLHQKEI